MEAQRLGSQRSVTFCLLKLAAIDLELGDLNRAADTIKACSESIARFQDRVYIAVMHHTAAQLELKRGHRFAAYENLIKAIDLFERLGMRRELAEARGELRRIEEMGEAPAA
ncbi:hypothetical protein K2Z83_16950 [Oscillochloris sp. ZM17-4]|uniref:hypothetical protein n=1 Tax=Oscillochloris sp. ZM17-4 TaxID=2866714 RepID=UPI001C73BFD2|nr:hypothetical protein [Oscillochloris sp. ZM17-4]MBX0329361.1 hypothetical protein [Oscillochloris sp. ZM17-4]